MGNGIWLVCKDREVSIVVEGDFFYGWFQFTNIAESLEDGFVTHSGVNHLSVLLILSFW